MCPPEGYGEAVVELLVTRRPEATFKSFHSGEEALSLDAALRGAPALIGKAPDLVFLGLGSSEILQNKEPEESVEKLAALVQLFVLKTHARIAIPNLCAAFFASESREAVNRFNLALIRLGGERVQLLDLDGAVKGFLEAHRRGGGEKRSLHVHAQKLTSTGRVFLSNAVYRILGFEEGFEEGFGETFTP